MIVFYNKKTGEIQGTIEGRVHPKEHLNMWVGDKAKTERLVVNWKPVKWYNKKGQQIDPIKQEKEVFAADFEPDNKQKDIFIKLDKTLRDIHKYRVDVKTKELIKK